MLLPHIQVSFRHICHNGPVGDIEIGARECSNFKILANILHSQGEFTSASELYRWILAREEKSLGKDHPDTLSTVHNMAHAFQNQGKYDEALEWYRRVLTGEEKPLGKDHPDTLTTVHNMAHVFQNQGKYDEALEWYRRALSG